MAMAEQAEAAEALPQAAAEAAVGLPDPQLLGAVLVEPAPAAASAGTHSCQTEAPSVP